MRNATEIRVNDTMGACRAIVKDTAGLPYEAELYISIGKLIELIEKDEIHYAVWGAIGRRVSAWTSRS